MKKGTYQVFGILVLSLILAGCASFGDKIVIDYGSAVPGGTITKGGNEIKLLGDPIQIGQPLPATSLVESTSMADVNLHALKGKVLFLSIVPSVDTKVCEAQTHYLGEEGDRLPPEVQRITISRDTPFAHVRFAEEGKLTDIQYLSDYKEGAFGRSVGLLVDGPMLLARTVILVDRKGIVRYIQVVPEITHMPDMEKAFDKAIELTKE